MTRSDIAQSVCRHPTCPGRPWVATKLSEVPLPERRTNGTYELSHSASPDQSQPILMQVCMHLDIEATWALLQMCACGPAAAARTAGWSCLQRRAIVTLCLSLLSCQILRCKSFVYGCNSHSAAECNRPCQGQLATTLKCYRCSLGCKSTRQNWHRTNFSNDSSMQSCYTPYILLTW